MRSLTTGYVESDLTIAEGHLQKCNTRHSTPDFCLVIVKVGVGVKINLDFKLRIKNQRIYTTHINLELS
jgi:hypothetical protein